MPYISELELVSREAILEFTLYMETVESVDNGHPGTELTVP